MKNIDMVIAHNQKELDLFIELSPHDIAIDFKGAILVPRGTKDIKRITLKNEASISDCGNGYYITCEDNTAINRIYDSKILIQDHCKIHCIDSVIQVTGKENTIYASGQSKIKFQGYGGDSFVYASDYTVVKWPVFSDIIATGNSYILSCNSCSIELKDFSSLFYESNEGGNTISAYNNSTVKIKGQLQFDDMFYGYHNSTFYSSCSINPKIAELHGGSNWVNLKLQSRSRKEEFLESRKIKKDEFGKYHLFKAVHKDEDGKYFSDYDETFTYTIGSTIFPDYFSPNKDEECTNGIHIADMNWCIEYGFNWPDLAILELAVDINDIILPYWSTGKMRASKAKVIREVEI